VPTGRVIFEIGGAPVREELAREGATYRFSPVTPLNVYVRSALRQASHKLPTTMEFIDRKSPPRLGNLLLYPEVENSPDSSATSTSPS
jgi:ribosomal protein L16/L10AE